ncbi:MAG TPA: Gfo/Idh/MocA family oxidoreductase [Pyrinomonadaceae bacterium]|nr:Gfo/Idh/MocA family oxidoreductase [Pyrinomonadaceae bacterium]
MSEPDFAHKPRLGFAGLGWIGRTRLESVVQARAAEVCALHDVTPAAVKDAQELAPRAAVCSSFAELLDHELDGVVIATPNRFHAEQSVAALNSGFAVFCQKPLGRNAVETTNIIEVARNARRLLGVDLSYQKIPAMQEVNALVKSGALGKIFAVEARFHNAYGPDKVWFRDYDMSGGGCVLDLGVHLIELALEPLQHPLIARTEGTLFSAGRLLPEDSREVEDYATALIETADGTTIDLSCSWNLHAGRMADIAVTFYGTAGGASLHNVDGSFYDFVAERFHGTESETLSGPADSQWRWGGLAMLEWISKLAANKNYDPAIERLITVAEIIDDIYGRGRK